MPHFPHTRLRRNRQTDWNRRLVQENTLSVNDFLIWGSYLFFVHEGETDFGYIPQPLTFQTNDSRWSIAGLCQQAQQADLETLGIPAIAISPATPAEKKTPNGEEANRTIPVISSVVR